MSIADAGTIDAMGIDEANGEVVLTIIDDLDWANEREHFLALERKINAYLGFIKSGGVVEKLPEALGRRVRIVAYQQAAPPANAVGVLEGLGRFLGDRDVAFSYGAEPEQPTGSRASWPYKS
ncbi:hypothetical protein QO010_000843 [Caulobacter ginsengisoli]|uniref:Uncharacterized protein n=1 Tax=Caulobacter ginsengisoli TaxID=400775 RepID=A0ABU0INT9_9CAUL|nr:DUF6572 domain-containing protein [Caulobacter ginsengisoli]MDQ0463095.1 hypothetical protein [Caulobacter ginsengisoli]